MDKLTNDINSTIVEMFEDARRNGVAKATFPRYTFNLICTELAKIQWSANEPVFNVQLNLDKDLKIIIIKL